MQTGAVFIGSLWAIGLLTGLVLGRNPEALPVPMPYFLVPLLAGLAFDLAVQLGLYGGRLRPVTMNERFLGVLGGSLLAFLAAALVAR